MASSDLVGRGASAIAPIIDERFRQCQRKVSSVSNLERRTSNLEQYMAIFVVAHGAWSSGWAWRKMRPLMRAAGHELFTPSYTGLGERRHLASRAANLSLHIEDVVNVLDVEDLREVVLVGHSF